MAATISFDDVPLEPVSFDDVPMAGMFDDVEMEAAPEAGVIQAVPVVAKQEDSWGPAIAAQEARLEDKPGLVDDFQNTWNSLKRGAFNARENFFGTGVVNALSASQEAQQAEKELADFDALVASNPQLQSSPNTLSQRNRLVSRMAELQGETAQRGETLGSNVQQVVRSREMAATVPVAGAMREFHEGNWVKALAENPVEVIAGISAESLPQMAPALLAGAISGPGGAALVGASSLGVEYSNTVIDSLKESKVDLANPDTFKNMTPEALESARKRAVQRGVPIAIFDAATAGLAGKVLKTQLGRGAGRAMLGVAAETGMQAAGGALGEATAQIASTGGVNDIKSVVSEAVGELVSTPSEVYGGLRESRKQEIQQPPSAPDLTDVAAILEEEDEAPTPTQGTAPAPEPPPTVTLAQQASANLLGTDATELRQQEAIVTGQPVPGLDELEATQQEQREWLNQNFPEEPAPEPVEEAAPVAVADEIVSEEGVDPTPVPEGLVALEPDTFERLADEPVQEGFVALQDTETNDVFQVPVAATPEQIQEARTAAREQSQMAEIQFLREENARKFEEARKEQDVLESIVKDPILRKNLTSGEKAREIWDVPSNLKFQLDRQEMNLRKAQAGTLKDSDGKPVPPAALENGVQMLRDRYAELTAKVAPAKEAVKGMKRGKKTEGSTQIPQAIVDLGESLYRQGVEFKDWSRAMIRNLGDRVRPILKQIWDGIVGSVNALSPAQRRRIEGRMQRSAPAPEGGAFGGQGGRRFQQAKQEGKTFTGLEGKERYEIDDSQMEVVGAPEVGESIPLGEVISHPELFDSYPEAANIKVKAVKGPPGASFNSTRNEITLSEYGGADLSNSRYYRRALLHEIQHWIQDKEGFARGGSVRDWNRQELRQQIEFLQEDIRNIEDEGYNSPEDADLERDSIRKKIQRLEKAASARDAYEYYERLAGEYEARDVSNRISLTREERASTSPYSSEPVPDKGLITRFGKGVMESQETPPDTPPPATPAEDAAPQGDEAPLFSIANAIVAETRRRMGMDERVVPLRRRFGEVWDAAMAVLDRRPTAAQDLVVSLSANPRPTSDIEGALLLYQRVLLEAEYDSALKGANEASTEEEVRDAQEVLKRARITNEAFFMVTETAGTQTARGLAIRAMLVDRDLNPARIKAEIQARDNKGAPLSSEQVEMAEKIYAELTQLREENARLKEQKANEDASTIFSAMMAEVNKEREAAKKANKGIRSFAKEQADKALERIKNRRGRLYSSIDPLNVAGLIDEIIVGTHYIIEGVATVGEYTAKMVSTFGEGIRKLTPQLYEESKKMAEDNQKVLGEGIPTETEIDEATEAQPEDVIGVETPTEKVLKTPQEILATATAELDPKMVADLVRAYIREGMTDSAAVIARVHADLLPLIPGLELREVRDAFTGYGKVTYPSREDDAIRFRDFKNIERLTSQLEDVQRRVAPLRTGPQRDALSAKARALQTQVNDLMRKYDLKPVDPLHQLKTSREAIKTRLRNEIEDIERAIQTRTARVRDKSQVAPDAEIEALRARRDQLRERENELFGKKGVTPEERVKQTLIALEKAIAEEDQMLKTGVLQRPAKAPRPTNDQIEAKRAELEAMRALRRELLAATQPRKAPEDIALEQAMKAAQASIDRMDQMLKSGNLSPAAKARKFTPTNELEALWSERDSMRDALLELRKAQKPRTDPEERARKQTVKMLEKSIKDLDRRITTGDFSSTPRKATRPDTKEVSDLRDMRDQMRKTFNDLKKAQTPKRSPDEIAISRNIKNAQNRIAKMKDRIARGDYAVAQKLASPTSPELRKVQREEADVKRKFWEGRLEAERKNASLPRKVGDAILQLAGLHRAIKGAVDLSAVLRQARKATFSHPVTAFTKALPRSVRAFFSEDYSRDLLHYAKQRPNYDLYVQSKLFLVDSEVTSLTQMEEEFQSRWIQNLPKKSILGPALRGSQRAYLAYLNEIRMTTFDAMAEGITATGVPTANEAKLIANDVNIATGRGLIPAKWEGAMPLASSIFWAVRLYASRIQMLTGVPYWMALKSPRARKVIGKEYLRYLMGTMAYHILWGIMLDASDEEDAWGVVWDPRSSEFGKIKLGNTRIDTFGGMAQFLVFFSRLISGQSKNNKGKVVPLRGDGVGYGKTDIDKVIWNFAETKRAPNIALIHDLIRQKHYGGKPFTALSVASSVIAPLSLGDSMELMDEQGIPVGTGLTAWMLLGESMMTYNDVEQDPLSRILGIPPEPKKGSSKMTKTDFGPTMK